MAKPDKTLGAFVKEQNVKIRIEEEAVLRRSIKDDIQKAILSNAEKWLRDGVIRVVVYPIPYSGLDFKEIDIRKMVTPEDQKLFIDHEREKEIYEYLKEEELTVQFFKYEGDIYITVRLE